MPKLSYLCRGALLPNNAKKLKKKDDAFVMSFARPIQALSLDTQSIMKVVLIWHFHFSESVWMWRQAGITSKEDLIKSVFSLVESSSIYMCA